MLLERYGYSMCRSIEYIGDIQLLGLWRGGKKQSLLCGNMPLKSSKTTMSDIPVRYNIRPWFI